MHNLLLNPTQVGYPVTKQSKQTRTQLLSKAGNNRLTIKYQNISLPATEEPHDWCHTWAYEGCLFTHDHKGENFGKMYVRRFQRACYRASCKTCSLDWVNREANAITRKIEMYMGKTKQKPIHLVVSVPVWDYGIDIKKLRAKANKLQKSVGVEGCAMFFHPFRFDADKNQWYVSPHFHLIGFGWIEHTEDLYKKEGWVVRNLGVRHSIGEVFGTVQYELSHCGVKSRSHSVTWLGKMSYSKLKVQKVNKEHVCPDCGRKLQPLTYNLHDWKLMDGAPPDGEFEGFLDPIGWSRVSNVHDKVFNND